MPPDARFRDSTDRPGPARWELAAFPSGQDDYPVGGISWYEANAYCRSVGKRLPTVLHWTRAALAPDEMFAPIAPAIIPVSNYGSNGPSRVGTFRGIGPYGTFEGALNGRTESTSTANRDWITEKISFDGGQDYVLPLEESQKPLFERLGTPSSDKRHVIFDAGHAADYPRSQTIREVVGWTHD